MGFSERNDIVLNGTELTKAEQQNERLVHSDKHSRNGACSFITRNISYNKIKIKKREVKTGLYSIERCIQTEVHSTSQDSIDYVYRTMVRCVQTSSSFFSSFFFFCSFAQEGFDVCCHVTATTFADRCY